MIANPRQLIQRRLIAAALGVCFALAGLSPGASRADTVASLLGNFTINQYCGLSLSRDAIGVHYVVVYGQLPALRELHAADADHDGVTTQAERDAYVGSLAPGFASGLALRIDGRPVPLRAVSWSSSLPNEQGGFSLRIDVDFAAALPAAVPGVSRALDFTNRNFPGRIGWHEIVVEPAAAIAVYDTDAFNTSLTGALTQALQALPDAGPLDERAVRLSFTEGSPPAGSRRLGGRTDSGFGAAGLAATSPTPTSAAPTAATPTAGANRAAATPTAKGAATAGPESTWISVHTRRLVDAISSPTVEPGVAFLTLLGALLLGAVHALSPGHGKTIVGAYLIGSRGTPRHALFLGLTVTITHTLGVFALGFATLYASRFVVPERLFPVLSLLSAVLVLGMGIALLVQRGRSAREWYAAGAGRTVFQPMTPSPGATHQFIRAPGAQHRDATLHSHGGGPLHSHLPPGASGDRITWRSLMALGISGGLVPCPSAMVLLLAAVALNKTAYGMLLVTVFSVGLAITLTLVGLAFLYARNRFAQPVAGARWTHLVPVLSAGTITVLGVALCIGALETFGR